MAYSPYNDAVAGMVAAGLHAVAVSVLGGTTWPVSDAIDGWPILH